jgi:YesN/AraC family two-component response regulator
MPEMDGLTTAQNILAMDPQAEIILLSGYDQKGPDGIDEEISRSIKGYITKPFDIAEVGRILGEMFR